MSKEFRQLICMYAKASTCFEAVRFKIVLFIEAAKKPIFDFELSSLKEQVSA